MEIKDRENISMTLRDISRIELRRGRLKDAEKKAIKSYDMAKEIGYPLSISFSSELLSEIYEKQGNGMEALKMHKLSIKMKDSISNKDTQRLLAQQQAKYVYERQKELDDAIHFRMLTIKKGEQEKQFILICAISVILVLITVFLIFTYKRLQVIKLQKITLNKTHMELERVNKEISDSINYAELIQYAVLPTLRIEDLSKESFIYFNPKEKVSGDFYWMEQRDEYSGFAVADCTGHGIPGAFISMIGTILLNEIYNSKKIDIPNEILDELSRLVRLTLTNKEGYTMKDGMDISFAVLDHKTKMLYFSGANNPVWIVSENAEKRINKTTVIPLLEKNGKYIYEIKGDKQPIGDYGDYVKPFTLNNAHLEEGDVFYLFSDGYVDQFGGDNNKKFKAKPFRELLLTLFDNSMVEQKVVLAENFQNWKGDYEQIDDVTVMGIRV